MGEVIHFRVLGPLAVISNHQQVSLGGTKQKATLAYLLLRANRVVPISQLLNALWPDDTAPLSARKILQNSVWSLRRNALAGESPGDIPALITQAPGYKLAVDPDDIDLNLFKRRVSEGRRMLANGEPEPAARILRDALALWRGPVLTDLVEADITWPELTVAQNTWWDAMEDHFDAELACGRHQALLSELETMVENNPARERAAGQLMLALYRGGRQADALTVYSRVRSALVDELGLEPGRELRTLQQSILAHNPALLSIPDRTLGPVQVTAPSTPTGRAGTTTGPNGMGPNGLVRPRETEHAYVADHPVAVSEERSRPGHRNGSAYPCPARRSSALTLVEPLTQVPDTQPEPAKLACRSERKIVSLLLVRANIDDASAEGAAPDVEAMLDEIARRIRENVEHFEGSVNATIGPVSLTLFDPHEDALGAAKRAVLAALSIGEDLRPNDTLTPAHVSFHAAVVTGEVLMRYPADSGAPVSVTGTLLDRCHALLLRTSKGEIRVCETTREATEPLAVYSSGEVPDDWRLQGIRRDYVGSAAGREFELGLLLGLLERTSHRSTTHMLTVLGDSGTGKTRLLGEFWQLAREHAHVASFRMPRRPDGATGPDVEAIHALQRELIKAICGIQPNDRPVTAVAKLVSTVHRLIDPPEAADRLVRCCAPYLDPELEYVTTDPQQELRAWENFLARTDFNHPFVLIVDDLHWADDTLLDFISSLAEFACGPLLVVATARSELLRRRPVWGGGKQRFTTITLESMSDPPLSPQQRPGRNGHGRTQTSATGWRKYIRNVLDLDASAKQPGTEPSGPAIVRAKLCGTGER